MKIHVSYFAQLREQMKRDGEVLTLRAPATPADILQALFVDAGLCKQMASFLRVAINTSYATLSTPLKDGDEVVFIPPVAGG